MPGLLEQLIESLETGAIRIVDLTRTLGPSTPVIGLPEIFGQSPGFSMDVISRYDERGPAWYWNTIRMGEHTGTHFDAPIHWITGKDLPDNACDTITPRRFIGPACVIDLREEVDADSDYLLTRRRIQAWEGVYGRIPRGSWVLLHTGWSTRRGTDSFLNLQLDGPHSPGFAPDASRYLVNDRDVLGVGVETVGTDAGQAAQLDPPFPSHHIMHGAGKFGLASLCNLDQLPPTGAVVIAAPLKLERGSGSPLRVLALVPAG